MVQRPVVLDVQKLLDRCLFRRVQGARQPIRGYQACWYCNDGYKKVGNSCEKLLVPPNAWVSGSNWYCK